MTPIFLSADDAFVLYLIVYIIGFIISVYITRAIFGIPTIISLLKVQTANQKIMRKVMIEMARKQGMTVEELERIDQESVNEVYK